jgi:hypothetical protein
LPYMIKRIHPTNPIILGQEIFIYKLGE